MSPQGLDGSDIKTRCCDEDANVYTQPPAQVKKDQIWETVQVHLHRPDNFQHNDIRPGQYLTAKATPMRGWEPVRHDYSQTVRGVWTDAKKTGEGRVPGELYYATFEFDGLRSDLVGTNHLLITIKQCRDDFLIAQIQSEDVEVLDCDYLSSI